MSDLLHMATRMNNGDTVAAKKLVKQINMKKAALNFGTWLILFLGSIGGGFLGGAYFGPNGVQTDKKVKELETLVRHLATENTKIFEFASNQVKINAGQMSNIKGLQDLHAKSLENEKLIQQLLSMHGQQLQYLEKYGNPFR